MYLPFVSPLLKFQQAKCQHILSWKGSPGCGCEGRFRANAVFCRVCGCLGGSRLNKMAGSGGGLFSPSLCSFFYLFFLILPSFLSFLLYFVRCVPDPTSFFLFLFFFLIFSFLSISLALSFLPPVFSISSSFSFSFFTVSSLSLSSLSHCFFR